MSFLIYTSVVIIDSENQILLVREKKEKNYNKLNLPGGHLEIGESPMEGAIREAKEEVSIEISLTGLIGIYLGRSKPSFHYIFTGKIENGIALGNSNEVLSAEWYPISEIMNVPRDNFVYFEKLQDVIKKYQSNKITVIDEVIFDLKNI